MSVRSRLTWTAVLLSVATLTAACGGGSNAASTSGTTGATAPAIRSTGGRAGAFPGVDGLVAAVEAPTMQVQGNGQQTAVTWTSATRFTTEKAATVSDVVVGSCVMVSSAATTATTTSGATPRNSGTAPTTVAAARVAIESRAADGTCTAGFGRGGGFRGGSATGAPGGAPTGAPGGMPTGRPTGARGGGFGGGGAFGTVKSVGSGSFTVESTFPAAAAGASTGSSGSATQPSRTVTVTVSSATTYSKRVVATAKAAVVGSCVSALGSTDETGTLAAKSVDVRPAVAGQCRAVAGAGGPRG